MASPPCTDDNVDHRTDGGRTEVAVLTRKLEPKRCAYGRWYQMQNDLTSVYHVVCEIRFPDLFPGLLDASVSPAPWAK